MSKTTALYVHHAYFFDVHRATTSLNLPMRRFMEDMDKLPLLYLNMDQVVKKFNSRKSRLHLTTSAVSNRRDKV